MPKQGKKYRIAGRVVDESGNPVPSVRVEARDEDWSGSWKSSWGTYDDLVGIATTDPGGRFHIEAPESHYKGQPSDDWPDINFKVYKSNRLIHQTERTISNLGRAGENAKITVRLAAAKGSITGRTVIRPDGDVYTPGSAAGIADVEVRVRRLSSSGSAPPPTYTNDDGIFTFDDLEPGEWSLKLEPRITAAGKTVVLADPALGRIQASLPPGGAVDFGDIPYDYLGGAMLGILFVNEDLTGAPNTNPRLQAVEVSLIGPQFATPISRTTTTDATGTYSFSGLGRGNYKLEFPGTLEARAFGRGEGTLRVTTQSTWSFHVAPGSQVSHNVGYSAMGCDIVGEVFLDTDASGQRFGNEPGINGVGVVLVGGKGDTVKEIVTDEDGGYLFRNVPAGTYTVRFIDAFTSPSLGELSLTTPETLKCSATTGKTIELDPTGYQLEGHEAVGYVTFDDGSPVTGLVVSLVNESGSVVDTALTDEKGHYSFKGWTGEFTLCFPEKPTDSQLLTPSCQRASIRSVFRARPTVYRKVIPGTEATIVTPTAGGLQDAVVDIASYMATSQEVAGPGARPVSTVPLGQAPLRQVVDGALIEVLGNKLKGDDPKMFLASLTRSFTPKPAAGRIDYDWTPRSIAVMTELGGGISGAQASIHHRARVALDDALPLIDGLTPLLPNFDEQEVEAARAILRTEFIEVVNELGVEGGPIVLRVDDLFRLLLEQVVRIRQVFGFTPNRVITVDEELNLTNFIVIADYIKGLEQAWRTEFRRQFSGTGEKFLGTQLVLLSRGLSVVAESVDEANMVMDSVFLGAAERQTVTIDFPSDINIDGSVEPILVDAKGGRLSDPPPMLVDELMSWVMKFAKEEGPALIQEGGRRGVAAMQPTARQLERLVLGAAQTTKVRHIGFTRNRVRRALTELAIQLARVERLARELLKKDDLMSFD